ncbi:MobH family relaxase [Pseudomonas fluorescens]|uniref:MobH family relaxase n=1 Tax=Pseudomonas fluorescens TaxID=294 RepID=UPI001BE6E480|nr:MobH family relaxase [Pseudomonas fluorescens]MBT2375353.1 TraI domain-containing protein [Pseudomonas fluorescens]
MLSWLRRKAPTPVAVDIPLARGFTAPQAACALLNTPHRRKLLETIWQRTSLSRTQFDSLYRIPLQRYAELVQLLPASESHHHAHPGGMLDHALETVDFALKLRQSHLLPIGAPPETQAAEAEVWTAAVAYAALLHDLGKIAVDLHIELADGTTWHPWHGPLAQPYRLRYRTDRQYRLHNAATGLLYNRVLTPACLDWLSAYPHLWASLLFVLSGQHEHAGVLGELVVRADQASVAQALGGNPSKAIAAPKQALQRKLIEGLRYLLKQELKLNQLQASDAWLTDDALWLVSKTVSDKLRAHLLRLGIEGIPERNTAVFNVLQDHGIALESPSGKAIWTATVNSDSGWSQSLTFLKLSPALIWSHDERPAAFNGTVIVDQLPGEAPSSAAPAAAKQTEPPFVDLDPDEALMDCVPALPTEAPPPADPITEMPPGEAFLQWLEQGIRSHRLIINDAKALVHTVADTLYLVSPSIFQRYCREHPHIACRAKQEHQQDWEWLQRQFERQRAHRKQTNGLNIWTCQVTGPRRSRRLHGYLLIDPKDLMGDIALNNPYLQLLPAEPEQSPPSTP